LAGDRSPGRRSSEEFAVNKPDLGELFETALKNKCHVHVVIQGHPFTITRLQAVRTTGHNVHREDHDAKYDKWLTLAESAPKGSLILVGCVLSPKGTDIPGLLVVDPDSVDAIYLS
jgi:hypothetical protein